MVAMPWTWAPWTSWSRSPTMTTSVPPSMASSRRAWAMTSALVRRPGSNVAPASTAKRSVSPKCSMIRRAVTSGLAVARASTEPGGDELVEHLDDAVVQRVLVQPDGLVALPVAVDDGPQPIAGHADQRQPELERRADDLAHGVVGGGLEALQLHRPAQRGRDPGEGVGDRPVEVDEDVGGGRHPGKVPAVRTVTSAVVGAPGSPATPARRWPACRCGGRRGASRASTTADCTAGRRADRARLADALGPERVDGRRRLHVHDLEAGQLGGRDHPVVGQVGRDRVAVLVVADLLQQRLGGALGHAAVDLALEEQRVDHPAGVVAGDVAEVADLAGLGVDLDDGDMGTERERGAAGVEAGLDQQLLAVGGGDAGEVGPRLATRPGCRRRGRRRRRCRGRCRTRRPPATTRPASWPSRPARWPPCRRPRRPAAASASPSCRRRRAPGRCRPRSSVELVDGDARLGAGDHRPRRVVALAVRRRAGVDDGPCRRRGPRSWPSSPIGGDAARDLDVDR